MILRVQGFERRIHLLSDSAGRVVFLFCITSCFYSSPLATDNLVASLQEQSDPIGVDGGVNFYAYVEARPVHLRDSLGLQKEMCAAGLSAWCPPPSCNCVDSPRSPPNGCGGGPTSYIIPNQPFGFEFEGCCNAHDICYGTCRGPGKMMCDLNFLGCMADKCKKYERAGFGISVQCKTTAVLYFTAVLDFSIPFYYSGRRGCCSE